MSEYSLADGLSRPSSPVRTPGFSDSDVEAGPRDGSLSPPPRGNRVRFQSVRRNPPSEPDASQPIDASRSDLSEQPLLPGRPSADLGSVPFAERTDSDPRRGSATREKPSPMILESDVVDRSGSARARFRAAGELIRQKTTRWTERLGRDPDDGEALNSDYIPDDLVEQLAPHDPNDEKSQTDAEAGRPHRPSNSVDAHRLVRSATRNPLRRRKPKGAYVRSGQTTPNTPELLTPDTRATRRLSFGSGGVLSQLLKLQAPPTREKEIESAYESSDTESQVSSGTATPKKEKVKWYKKPAHQSTASLVGASMNLSRASLPATADPMGSGQPKEKKERRRGQPRLEDEIRITVHIAEILARQRYIMQLCRALMRFGAPTHRLEEYMHMTARVLDVPAQFLYLPGCMVMAFEDPSTRTTEVKLVRVVQGVDLGRLADTHNVYKNVLHDMIGVEQASQELDEVMKRPDRFNKWLLVPIYGVASAAVGPFAFSARPIDMPIIFILGSLLGFMRHVLAPKSVLYSNVFEVTAAILTSFLSRAFGSITRSNGDYMFCFSALSQSSIALILPGFLVLCSSLELQSHQIIAGSIRMVYAVIYSLFLGYGITVGTMIYGLMDENASSESTCKGLDVYGSPYLQRFPFVAIFCVLLAIINQGKWKQTPVMTIIGVLGYVTNYFSTTKFGSRSEVANTVGAFTIGVLGNLYSRLWHGHAAAAILPGIFVLVPSGLAASGSLIAGLNYAHAVREHIQGNSSTVSTTSENTVTSLGFGMIQVAIGITVGLFIAALVVYPYGKRRSGLFSF